MSRPLTAFNFAVEIAVERITQKVIFVEQTRKRALLTELFAQRLGIQTGATRVITKAGVQSVDLFHTPSLRFRDHDEAVRPHDPLRRLAATSGDAR